MQVPKASILLHALGLGLNTNQLLGVQDLLEGEHVGTCCYHVKAKSTERELDDNTCSGVVMKSIARFVRGDRDDNRPEGKRGTYNAKPTERCTTVTCTTIH